MSLQAAFESEINGENPLEGIESIIWQSLAAGVVSSKHPWNLGNFSTVIHDKPATRTVVLRRVDFGNRQIDFFTDVRSSKIESLESSNHIAWHFYTTASKIQLRCAGTACIVTDEHEIAAAWERTSLRSRSAYLSLSLPGKSVDGSEPPSTEDRFVSQTESERGKENFTIVRTTIASLDWLYLRSGGHLRMSIDYSSSPPRRHWLIP